VEGEPWSLLRRFRPEFEEEEYRGLSLRLQARCEGPLLALAAARVDGLLTQQEVLQCGWLSPCGFLLNLSEETS